MNNSHNDTAEDSCCMTKEKESIHEETTQDTEEKCCHENIPTKSKPMQTLIAILGTAVILNILVMGWFTFSVNDKLTEAVESTKPQTGLLTLILPSDCDACGEMEAYVQHLESQNISITDTRRLDASSDTAKTLVKEKGITTLPAMIFVSDKAIRDALTNATKEAGSRLSGENSLVWEKNQPPSVDVQSGTTSGLVTVTYLTDKSCATCYDVVSAQRSVLQRFGVGIASEQVLDVTDASAKSLITAYTIQDVPTIILSQEAGVYDALMQVWPQVGTKESDGVYVFREMQAIGGTYKNVTTGKITTPEPAT